MSTRIGGGLAGLLIAVWLTGGLGGCQGSSSGGAGGGGAGGGGAGGTGGAPPGNLIDGGPEGCPGHVPVPTSSCAAGSGPCTYQGGDFGISSTYDPLTCHCNADMAWICILAADELKGCPLEYPPAAACATALSCSYATVASTVLCNCTPGAGGAGGAGSGSWLCGL